MAYTNDWVTANITFIMSVNDDEDLLRAFVRGRLSPLKGLEVVALEDAQALFGECDLKMVVDHCKISTANGLSLRATEPHPDDECLSITGRVDLVTGRVSCWERDTCEPEGDTGS